MDISQVYISFIQTIESSGSMKIQWAVKRSSPTLWTAPPGVLHIIVEYLQCNIWMVKTRGENPMGTLGVYDVCYRKWTTLRADIPHCVKVTGTCIVSDRVFVIQLHEKGSVIGLSVSLNGRDVRTHNTAIGRRQMGMASLNGSLYFIGGRRGRTGELPTKLCDRYHDEKLTRIGELNDATYSAGAEMAIRWSSPETPSPIVSTTYNGQIYIFGGRGDLKVNSEVYDPSKDTWTSIPYHLGGRKPSACITVGDNIFVFSEIDHRIYCCAPNTGKWSVYNISCVLPGLRCVYYNDGTMYLISDRKQKEIPNFDRNGSVTHDVVKPMFLPPEAHIAV